MKRMKVVQNCQSERENYGNIPAIAVSIKGYSNSCHKIQSKKGFTSLSSPLVRKLVTVTMGPNDHFAVEHIKHAMAPFGIYKL